MPPRREGEEMIGARPDSRLARVAVVVFVVGVEDRAALRRFHVGEGDRIIDLPPHPLVAQRAEMGDAQSVPVDGVALPVPLVLVARHVDTVDALLVVGQFLPFEDALAPFSRLQILAWRDIESEAVGQSRLEMAPRSILLGVPSAVRSRSAASASRAGGIGADRVADRAVVVLAHLLLAGLQPGAGRWPPCRRRYPCGSRPPTGVWWRGSCTTT